MPNVNLTTIATSALEDLMVLDAGGAASTAQLDQARRAMNSVLENLSVEQLWVPEFLLQTFALSANVGTYTIGTGQTWNTTRPVSLETAVHINTLNGVPLETPIGVVNAAQWAAIQDRGESQNFIKSAFYDRGYPTGNVYVSPRPLGGSIQLGTYVALDLFADNTTPVNLPNGYQRPLEKLLAMELATKYDMAPNASLVASCKDATARIRNLNAALMGTKPPTGQTDADTQPPTMIQTG